MQFTLFLALFASSNDSLTLGGELQAAAKPDEERPLFGYGDGFFLRTADGRYELDIEGRLQFDGAYYGGERRPQSDFILRRMRLEFTGTLPGEATFHFEPNFTADGVELEEAWLGWKVFDADARLMFGRMKAPFELEERAPQVNVDFARFSIVHQFAPAEDHGVFLYGTTPSKALDYEFAVYNGTGNSDTNSSKDVAARGVWHPFAGDAASSFEHLQIGAAATFGAQDDDVAGSAIENESKLPVLVFANGARLDGDRTRVGLESAWFSGPWMAQAELVCVRQAMSSVGSSDAIDFTGGYVDVSRVLTGEAKDFHAVHPRTPFDFRSGTGGGAWIVALRASELRCDSTLESGGYVAPGTFTDSIRTITLGLNWVPNEHVILRNSLSHTWYSDEVQFANGSAREENALIVELQFSF